MSAPVFGYDIFIGVPPEKVWNSLIDSELTPQYVYGTRFEGKLTKGAPYAYVGEGNFKAVDGQILDVQPGKRLAMTWSAHWDDATNADRPSRVTWELAPAGAVTTRLRIVHDDFDSETATYKGSVEGWPLILSSLKTLLESGKPLPAN